MSSVTTWAVCYSLPSACHKPSPWWEWIHFHRTSVYRLVFLNQNLAGIGYKTMPLAPSTTYKPPPPKGACKLWINPGFLNLGTIKHFGLDTLCCEGKGNCPVHCKTISRPVVTLNARSIPYILWQPKMSPEITKCPLKGKNCPRLIYGLTVLTQYTYEVFWVFFPLDSLSSVHINKALLGI